MEFRKEIIIDQPIEEVWKVLGENFGEAYKWASGVSHSESFGRPKLEGATCSNRACDTTFGSIKEQVRIFDAKNHILEYEVIEGFPNFMDYAINNWSLTAKGNQTLVKMHLRAKTKGVMGTLMSPMMKIKMGNAVGDVLNDLKQYVETGEPSASKAKEIRKQQAAMA